MHIKSKTRATQQSKPVPPDLAAQITLLTTSTNPSLAFPNGWTFPKSDFHHFIPVLNRFDDVLAQGAAADKELVCGVLRITKLLWENCTSRNIYSSFEHLIKLLYSTDLDILAALLRLLFRPAQRIQHQRSARSGLVGIMEPISVLASPLSDTALNYQFYGKKEDGGKEGLIVINFANPASMIKGGGSSPRRQSKRTSTTVVHENEKELEEWIIKEYGVPEKHRFAVKHRLMRALVNASGVEAEIERLKEVRMLAVGIWVNMIGEDVAQSKIFLYEPDLVSKCADVLRDGNYASQTTALYVLDSVARYRGKQGEVCLAVNIGASHGVLMVALQKVMAYFAQEGNEGKVIPMEFIDALFGLVSLLSSQVASAQAVNSSGLVGMLVGALENYKVDQRRSVCRCLGILDSVLFQPSASSTANSNTAHGLFTAAKGIELIVERLKYEVGECCKEGGGEDMMDIDGRGEIPYDRVSLLRGMLRLVLHLMQGSGTVDGVRNLIEGGLPGSLLKIIAGEGFPASVFCIAVNIMSTFIHNEPTSLAILQEMGVPQAFLKRIGDGTFPVSAEVAIVIPHAIGALCLNEAGLGQVGEAGVFGKFFGMFKKGEGMVELLENDVPHIVGTSLDELVRHHPGLKDGVLGGIEDLLGFVHEVGKKHKANMFAWTEGDKEELCELFVEGETGVDVEGVRFTKYLECVAKNTAHAKDFSKMAGAKTLIEYVELPCIPYDFAGLQQSYGMGVIFRALVEVNPAETVKGLIDCFERIYGRLGAFLGDVGDGVLGRFIDVKDGDALLEVKQSTFHDIVAILSLTRLIGDIFTAHGLSQTKSIGAAVQFFDADRGPMLLAAYANLWRVFSWEGLLFDKNVDPLILEKETAVRGSGGLPELKEDIAALTEVIAHNEAVIAEAKNGTVDAGAVTVGAITKSKKPDPKDSRVRNTRMIKYLVGEMPTQIAATMHAIVKVMSGRRSTDAATKASFQSIFGNIATGVVEHLKWTRISGADAEMRHEYLVNVLSYFSAMLVDERTNTQLQTGLVNAFDKIDGIGMLVGISNDLWTELFNQTSGKGKAVEGAVDVVDKKPDGKKSTLVQSIELLLSVFHTLTNHKLLSESLFTVTLIRDKVKGRGDLPFDDLAFLLRIRGEVLKHLKSIWTDARLSSVGQSSVVKGVIQIIVQILRAEGEAAGLVAPVEPTATTPAARAPRVAPDEEKVVQLMDMGFPRGAAEMALVRTGNSLARATEYLLMHPHLVAMAPPARVFAPVVAPIVAPAVPAEGDPVDGAIMSPVPVVAAVEAVAGPVDAPMDAPPTLNPDSSDEDQDMDEVEMLRRAVAMSTEASAGGVSSSAESVAPVVSVTVDYLGPLNLVREELRASIMETAICVLVNVGDIVFDIKELLTVKESTVKSVADGEVGKLADFLLLEISKLQANYAGDNETYSEGLARVLQLFAVLVSDGTYARKFITKSRDFINSLLELVENCAAGVEGGKTALPGFLSSVCLIVEAYITLSDEVKAVSLDRKPEMGKYRPPEVLESPEPLDYEKKVHLLGCICRILKGDEVHKDVVFALMQICVNLTRDEKVSKGMDFVVLFKGIGRFVSQGGLVAMILRHVVEGRDVLKRIVEEEVKGIMKDKGRAGVLDLTAFLVQGAGLVVRDEDVFCEAVGEGCEVLKFDHHGRQQISLVKEVVKEGEAVMDGVEVSKSEGLAGYFVSEILALKAPTPVVEEVDTELQIKQHLQRCFILPLLAELCFSYPSFRVDVINASQSKGGKGKKNSFLAHLLNDLLPVGMESAPVDVRGVVDLKMRERWMESGKTVGVLMGLVEFKRDPVKEKKNWPETVAVRKSVCEAIARSIKDAIALTDAEQKYARFIALSDLAMKMIGGKGDGGVTMSKFMLEKGAVGLFTGMVQEIDVWHPGSGVVVERILRPLEILTKVAIKTGRHPEGTPAKKRGVDVGEGEEQETRDAAAAAAEETQNAVSEMYRNSSLGMFSPENNDSASMSSETGDEDDEGEDDFDEEGEFDDSMDEDGAEQESDVEDEMEIILPPTYHNANDMETSDDEDEEDGGGDDSDDGEEDADEMIHGFGDEMPGEEVEDDESEDEEEGGGLDMNDYPIDMDEEDDESDDEGEEYPIEFGDDPAADGLIFAQPPGGGAAARRRNLRRNFFQDLENRVEIRLEGGPGGGIGILEEGGGFAVRGIGAGGGGLDEGIYHPLLVNPAVRPVAARGGIRAPGGRGGLDFSSFDELLGGQAMQLLEQVFRGAMNGRPSGGPMRLEIPGGGELGRLANSLRMPERAENAGPVLPLNEIDMVYGFSPMGTMERWNQEAKMRYGKEVGSKAARVGNKVLNVLVPAAVKVDEEKKKKEEEARKVREAAEKVRAEEARVKAEEAEAIKAEEGRVAEEARVKEEEEQRAEREAAGEADVSMEEAEVVVPERVFVSIGGNEIDVTDMGIDVEFLNALPDDMRQEVLDQHVREQAPEQAGSNSISNDFLDALPADIRNEIIEQERIEAARRERAAAPPVAAAALDPEMRAAVLNEEDPAFLNSLSPDLLAEVNQMRERLRNNRAGRAGASSSAVSGKKAEKRDAVQLVDKAAVMSLLRLLFVPEPVSKTLIMRLLGNVAENSKTRVELLTVLLCLLNEGCADLAAVDKLFGGKGKGKVVGGGISNLVELRCLEALGELVKGNSAVVPWFVTENEGFFAVLGKTPREKAKKGKGKLGEGRIPVVVLLEMLGRDGYLQSGVGGMMEHLMHLLSWILKPREVLKAVDGVEEKAIVEEVKALEPVVEVGAASPMDTSSTPVLETGVVEAVAEKKLEVKKTPEPLFELEVSSIPEQYVRSVINVLTGSDCPNKTFAYTMTVIQHLLSLKKYETIVIKELVESVHELGKAIIPGLEDLLEVVKKDGDKTEIISTFSKPSSTQSKLLRVLKSLDFIYAKNVAKRDVGSLKAVYDDFKLSDVWISLGLCLEVINTKSDLISVGTILLPLIEAFLVVSKPYIIVGSRQHAPSTTKDMKRKDARLMSNEELFVAFTEDHRKILNTMVRNNTSLMSGSFSLLVQNPKGLDFDNKRTYFTQVLHKRSSREQYGPLQLNVRREFVFEDSYQQMQGRTGPEVKHGKLSVRFYEEEGVDAGGVTREWFSELARQLFNPNYALFKPAAVDKITYQPNRSSWINPDHLFYFKFVGRIIGKAIYDARLLDCYFTRSFYKFMLGVAVDWKDMEAVDPEFHKSLEWILGNDITDVLDLTFCCEVDDFGRMKNVDLKEGGSGIPVTEENKLEYVKLITEQKLQTAIKDQIDAFLSGFHDIIPKELIKIFNEQELELLISGLPDIDVDDWKSNTEYQNYGASSTVVQWFWRVVRSFSGEERAKLLQFITGTSKVPLEGFAALEGSNGVQKFQIHKDFTAGDRLPSAHTCFNQLDMPEYESYEALREGLLKAVNEGGTGFGFA